MRVNVAPTDGDWWRFLASRPHLTEANFWVPAAHKTYGLAPGSPVIFRSKASDGNRLVGGGWLAGYAVLTVSEAWLDFGEQNGCETPDNLLAMVHRYQTRNGKPADADPEIGCVMLRDTVFFPPHATLPAPRDFPVNNPGPTGFQLDGDVPPEVIAAVAQLGALAPARPEADLVWEHSGSRYGAKVEVSPRLGQSSFAAKVAEAYRLRCAITGAKVRPILQAAHIRPYKDEGPHRVDNGLLLRADVHLLFDDGYLGVKPGSHELLVSRHLREIWGNGDEFYSKQGRVIARPDRNVDRPNTEFLDWHMSVKYRG